MDDQETITSTRRTDQNQYNLAKRPWRRNVTPWEKILNHHYEGEGTEEKPYLVDWVSTLEADAEKNGGHEDAENPMTWHQGYKWFVVLSVALATLAVAMASSTL
jgi:hypothetical protein